jgi:hypothetical protein
MRGKDIDNLHRAELKKQTGRAEARALRKIRNLHLTVIDGEFDRAVLAADNLKFARYRMPKHRNNKNAYDALRAGPGANQGGVLYRSSVDDLEKRLGPNGDRLSRIDVATPPSSRRSGWLLGSGLGLLAFFGVGRSRP